MTEIGVTDVDLRPVKQALRKEIRTRRNAFVAAMAPGERETLAARAAERIEPDLAEARCVSGFIPFGSEIDPIAALRLAAARGLMTALPHVTALDQPMRFLLWRPDDPLEPGPYGLQQPIANAQEVDPDLVLMPMVGFDRTLNRIGNGAGFYDRKVASIPGARRIGIAWSVQQVDVVPIDPWDQPLDAVLTELERYELEVVL